MTFTSLLMTVKRKTITSESCLFRDTAVDPRLLGFISVSLVSICLILGNIFYLYNSRNLRIPSTVKQDRGMSTIIKFVGPILVGGVTDPFWFDSGVKF